MLEPVTFEDSPFVPKRSSTPTPRILVVDDDEGILQSLSQLLRLSFPDCKVATAASAEDAIASIKMAPVDLVITDLKLPTIDGLELTKQIRHLSSNARFILMTAYGSEQIMQTAHDNGCIAYLEKPFDIDLLLKYVEAGIRPYLDLKAELSGLGVLDVVELYMRRAMDALLSVTCEGSSGLIVIENGIVVHAQYEDLSALPAFHQMAQIKTGLVTSLRYSPAQNMTLQLGLEEVTKIAREVQPSAPAGSFRFNVYAGKVIAPPLPPRKNASVNASDPLRKEILNHDPSVSTVPEGEQPDHLELHPEADQVVLIKEAQVKKLVADGIQHFKAQNFEEAGYCWTKALRLDPGCVAAKKNLQLLEKAMSEKDIH